MFWAGVAKLTPACSPSSSSGLRAELESKRQAPAHSSSLMHLGLEFILGFQGLPLVEASCGSFSERAKKKERL